MATLTQIGGTVDTIMSTELNSLANNTSVVSSVNNSGVIVPTSSGYPQADVELVVTFGTNPTANSTILVWFLAKPDGTNYEDGSSSVTPTRNPDAIFAVRATTNAQRLRALARLPVGAFKVLLLNNATGQSFASSGNTLKIRPITNQVA